MVFNVDEVTGIIEDIVRLRIEPSATDLRERVVGLIKLKILLKSEDFRIYQQQLIEAYSRTKKTETPHSRVYQNIKTINNYVERLNQGDSSPMTLRGLESTLIISDYHREQLGTVEVNEKK